MSEPIATISLELRRTFPATRERLFRAFTQPEGMKRWMAPDELRVSLAEANLQIGGRWRVHMQAPDGTLHKVTGVYREIDEPRRLVYTWHWETDPPEWESVVTVEFRIHDTQTEVILTHEGFTEEQVRDRHATGWARCLVKLSGLFD